MTFTSKLSQNCCIKFRKNETKNDYLPKSLSKDNNMTIELRQTMTRIVSKLIGIHYNEFYSFCTLHMTKEICTGLLRETMKSIVYKFTEILCILIVILYGMIYFLKQYDTYKCWGHFYQRKREKSPCNHVVLVTCHFHVALAVVWVILPNLYHFCNSLLLLARTAMWW